MLRLEAQQAGVKVWCRVCDDQEANIMYCGREKVSGKHIFTADFTRYVRMGLQGPIFWENRSFKLDFDPSLEGDAELVTVSDSFVSCNGGKAEYDEDTYVLVVRFRLPGKLMLSFGKGRVGLTLDMAPEGAKFPSYLP